MRRESSHIPSGPEECITLHKQAEYTEAEKFLSIVTKRLAFLRGPYTRGGKTFQEDWLVETSARAVCCDYKI